MMVPARALICCNLLVSLFGRVSGAGPTGNPIDDRKFGGYTSMEIHDMIAKISANPPMRGITGAPTNLFENSTSVKEMTPNGFTNKVINGTTPWVVDFYVDHCDKCKKLVPMMQHIATTFAHEPTLQFAALNCNKHNFFCVKLGVKSHPTIKAYHFPSIPDSAQKEGHTIELTPSNYTAIGQWVETNLAIKQNNDIQQAAFSAAPSPKPKDAVASMSTARQRLIDAEVALLFTFRRGVFLHAEVTDEIDNPEMVLKGDALSELRQWLKILRSIITTPKAQQQLYLLNHIAGTGEQVTSGDALKWTDWLDIVDNQGLDELEASVGMDPAGHWKLCATYTCGLWTLFHMVTVAAAEGRAGGLQPMDALYRIQGFVRHFFSCADCVNHFLTIPPDLPKLDASEGERLVVWLWQIHNGVTHRVARESSNEETRKKGAVDWPAFKDCPKCWNDDQSSGNAAMRPTYEYIRDSFMTPGKDGWKPQQDCVLKGETSICSGDGAAQNGDTSSYDMLNTGMLIFGALFVICVVGVVILLVKNSSAQTEMDAALEQIMKARLEKAEKAKKETAKTK